MDLQIWTVRASGHKNLTNNLLIFCRFSGVKMRNYMKRKGEKTPFSSRPCNEQTQKHLQYCKPEQKAFCTQAGVLAEMNGQHAPALIISQA